MLHHCRAVARGCEAPFLVADLPYGSYEASPDDAVKSALRFMKEGNCEVNFFLFLFIETPFSKYVLYVSLSLYAKN
jgi:hypothetical protein